MARILLVHWNETEAKERALTLESAGHHVWLHWSTMSTPSLKDELPAIVVISLDRLPSHGRAIAEWLWEARKRRHIPIVFASDAPARLDEARKKFPKAVFCPAAAIHEEVAKLAGPRSSTAYSPAPLASAPERG